jgi:hypothetical protein
MDRPDVEGIEERLRDLIAGPTYTESLYLIGWIKELEADQDLIIRKFNEDLNNALEFHAEDGLGNLIGELKKELKELRDIGEEFIQRVEKGDRIVKNETK